jgi:membrane-associated phospholipid phosphatase
MNALLTAVLLLASETADVPPGGDPLVAEAPSLAVYKVDLPVETTVTAASLGLFVLIDILIKPSLEGDISCRRPIGNGRCDPADLAAIDRYPVGRTKLPSSAGWAAFSDASLAGSLLLPLAWLGLESLLLPTDSPFIDFANDAIVVVEAVSLTGAMNTVFKFAFRRPRPVRYSDVDVPLATFDQELSVPSGHTALVTAATTALTTTFFLRHPDSPWRWAVLGGGLALSALTGFARIESGNHFPTDTMVGALLGGLAGFLVPYFHRNLFGVRPVASFDAVSGSSHVGLTGRF